MKLLDQKEVAEVKSRETEELMGSLRKLREEQSASVKRVNDAVISERAEIEASKARVTEFEQKENELKRSLEREVGNLEKRKRDALAPLIDREHRISVREQELEDTENDLKDAKNSLESATISMRLSKDDYESKVKSLDIKELSIKNREKKHAEDVSDFNRNIKARESKVNDEYARLRKYFEAEDEKLKQKQHG